MAIEFVIVLEEDATEEEQKDLARKLCLMPVVVTVSRRYRPDPVVDYITHKAPGAMH
jgi:hypothetical protein